MMTSDGISNSYSSYPGHAATAAIPQTWWASGGAGIGRTRS